MKWFQKIKPHFNFSQSERRGILVLNLLLAGLLLVYFTVDLSTETTFDVASPEITSLQNEMDSLRSAQLEARKPKRYPFNPNFITDHRAYTLGMPPAAFDKLKAFRAKGQWINSTADFKRVTGISDSLLAVISPYFKFPEWVTNPKQRAFTDFNKERPHAQKTDLNTATAEQLQQVPGIGKTLGARIVGYRKKLGGFSADLQLGHVYGLAPDVVRRTLNRFTVKTPKPIVKLNVNKASASDIATIPGINFELAKKIWEYRRLREGILTLDGLKNIDGVGETKFELLTLYLSVE
ncbi:MAG: ComEA family DNA-binding protein [Marinirhabdus sp.]